MISDQQGVARGGRGSALAIAAFVAGVVVAPFMVTLLARLIPSSWPLWIPSAVAGVVGVVAVTRHGWARLLGAGLLVGTVVFEIFLAWLVGDFVGLRDM